MSNASDVSDTHYATFHAFLLAAEENGLNEFRLESSTTEQGKLKISIFGDGMLGQFDVRGNVVRPAVPTAKIDLPPQSSRPLLENCES